MDIAKCLSVIGSLCAGELPLEDGGSQAGAAGAGYRTVELETSHETREDLARTRERTAEDFQACRDAIAERLDHRWGRRALWGQLTVRVRLSRGEEIPEPWATLALLTDELDLWQEPETGRWVALGVAHRDEADETRLLATVTETPPP
ncbi:hypothetical protein A6P39_034700 [Streptomyces sp. FXJ1.172]|uniref:hypothetical protein n=1 Tax=Streptomyces sp. FXJ1.172 TaxID=710705 RepID=UPI0007D00EDD|nr:hypothetical protein [Streptomyces sp. FXJ1.172]WEO98778.1 hypothetical protein A6P39_034700 [Streptomyces sp. FXJ1.172]